MPLLFKNHMTLNNTVMSALLKTNLFSTHCLCPITIAQC